jgi:ABC-2 type transport system ATP-binding protein
MYAIETRDMAKTYENGVTGLEGLSIQVDTGSICGLLGPNGAGKSTTVRLLNGTLVPTKGDSSVLGSPGGAEEIRKKTATLAESAQLYEHLSVSDNLRFYGALYDMDRSDVDTRIDRLLSRLDLAGKKDLKLGSFSTGMRKRVQLARTLLHSPAVLFLDEPTSGLDPEGSVHVINLIESLAREEGTTVLLCTHNLTLAERICDSFGLLDEGTLAAFGSKDELFRSVKKEQRVQIVSQLGEEQYEFDDPKEINGLIKDVMSRGGYVQDVSVVEPSLEDVYFHYVGKQARENGGKK